VILLKLQILDYDNDLQNYFYYGNPDAIINFVLIFCKNDLSYLIKKRINWAKILFWKMSTSLNWFSRVMKTACARRGAFREDRVRTHRHCRSAPGKDASPRSTRASCILSTNESSRLRISEHSKSRLTYRVYLNEGLRDTNERVDAR